MRILPRVQASYAITIFSTICLLWVGVWAKYLKTEERNSEDGSSLDLDLIIMINFCKAHMLAVNYENAGKLDNPEASKYFTDREKFYAEPLRNALAFDDFFHYFFCCAVSYSGMVHEYRDFEDFINQKGNYSNVPRKKLFLPAFQRFAQIIVWAILLLLYSQFFPKDYLVTDEYSQHSLPYKMIYLMGAC